ncbi:uncharacterized protein AMSG_09510 [Thecamonas trahens ATCC 50062]|uniref:Fibronectin type-III domain-containing protein n=1 Tax=Thecamonas trahens ATCC 50062 TaxID=461836 RepID=A0A0L0DNF5_THETB|nr:hypothetical protein AMSG_09510 [Thecamonas trahens ATCC 50062]KNC53790.1 hypothetical protein AMSG_09510 [Thecamonas trahens ATCC 50062]|eukprot:XP_013754351.1 hypothetical protein AMSG_09510 [Thecamonas trahens ATCC 50062]
MATGTHEMARRRDALALPRTEAVLTPPSSLSATAVGLSSATLSFTLPAVLPCCFSIHYSGDDIPGAEVILELMVEETWSPSTSQSFELKALPSNASVTVWMESHDAAVGIAGRNSSAPTSSIVVQTKAAALSCNSPIAMASSAAFGNRFRGNNYVIGSTESVLVDFGLQLDISSSMTIYFAVYEKVSGSSGYVEILRESRVAVPSEGTYKYHSGGGARSLALVLKPFAEYVIGSFWLAETPTYFFSSSAPAVTSFCFGDLDSGAAASVGSASGPTPSSISLSSYYGMDVVVAAADSLPPSPSLAVSQLRPDSAAVAAGPIVFSSPLLEYHALLATRPVGPSSVYRRLDLGGTAGTLVKVRGLSAATDYAAFQLVSVSNDVSDLSAAVNFTTPPLPVVAPAAAPTATVRVVGRSLAVTWNEVDAFPTSHVVGYRVAGSSSAYTTVALGVVFEHSFDLLDFETTYEVVVTAYNGIGPSPTSSPVEGTIPALLCIDEPNPGLPTRVSTTSRSGYVANLVVPSRPLALSEIKVYAVYDGIKTLRFLVRKVADGEVPFAAGPRDLSTKPADVLVDKSLVIDATVADSPAFKSSGPVQALLVPGETYHVGVIFSSAASLKYMTDCDEGLCTSDPASAPSGLCLNPVGSATRSGVATTGDAATIATTSVSYGFSRYFMELSLLALADAPPTDLRLAVGSTVLPTSAQVAWKTPLSGVPSVGYLVQLSTTSAAGPWSDVLSTASTSVEVTGLAGGTTSWLRVVVSGSTSLASNTLSVTTPPLPVAAPAAPTGVSASINSATGQLDVAFGGSITATSYELRLQWVGIQSDVSVVDIGTATVVNITQPFALPNTELAVVVAAVNAVGSTAAAAVTLVTPQSSVGPPPTPGPASIISASTVLSDLCPYGMPATGSKSGVSRVGGVYYAREEFTLRYLAIQLYSTQSTATRNLAVTIRSSTHASFDLFDVVLYSQSHFFSSSPGLLPPSSSRYLMTREAINVVIPAGTYYRIDVAVSSLSLAQSNLFEFASQACNLVTTSAVVPVATYLDDSSSSSRPPPPPPPPPSPPPGAPPSPPPPPPLNIQDVYSQARSTPLVLMLARVSSAIYAAPPRDVQITTPYPSSAVVTWREPIFGVPDSYRVSYRLTGESFWHEVAADAVASRVESPSADACFDDGPKPLEPAASGVATRHYYGGCWSPEFGSDDDVFDFYVAANHNSASSSWEVELDGETLTSGAPSRLSGSIGLPSHCPSVNQKWFKWSGYTIAAGTHSVVFKEISGSSSSALTMVVKPSSTGTIAGVFATRVSGLVAGGEYEFRVHSVMASAKNPISPPAAAAGGSVQLPAAPTSAPAALQLTRADVAGVQARFAWSLGARAPEYVTHVSVVMEPVASGRRVEMVVDREECSAVVSGLSEFTSYRYNVTAYNAVGASQLVTGAMQTGAGFRTTPRFRPVLSKVGIALLSTFLILGFLLTCLAVKACYDRGAFPEDYVRVAQTGGPRARASASSAMVDLEATPIPAPFPALPAGMNAAITSSDDDVGYGMDIFDVKPRARAGSIPDPPPLPPGSDGATLPALPSYGEAIDLKNL